MTALSYIFFSAEDGELHSKVFISIAQFYIDKENRGNEGTCVGVACYPLQDDNHRSSTDMWLYRAYSGNLYHGGEVSLTLSGFTQGDTITCVLDMEAKTLAFGKNDEVMINLCLYKK